MITYSDPIKIKGSDRWYSRTRDPVTGKRSYVALQTTLLKVAKERLNTLRMEAAQGIERTKAAKVRDITFGAAVAEWLAEKKDFVRFFVYQAQTRYWLAHFGGNQRLAEITAEDVKAYLRRRAAGLIRLPLPEAVDGEAQATRRQPRELAGRTINEERRSLRGFARWCLETGKLSTSPLVGVAKAKETPREQVFELSDDEEQRLLRSCSEPARVLVKAHRNTAGRKGGSVSEDKVEFSQTFAPPAWLAPLVSVALNSGLRRRTLVELRWKHADLENARWKIPATAIKTQEQYHQPMTKKTVEILTAWRAARLFDEGVEATKPDAKIFGLSDPSCASKSFARAARRAGMPKLSLHDLRRVFSSRVVKVVDDPRIAMALTGHKNLGTLMEYYLRKAKSNDAAKAIAALDGAQGPAANVVSE